MSVRAIRLQNFTAFEDTDWVELRPITLLFGRNSSGKSALIRALLLLKQSLLPPDDRVFVYSTPFGVDLGGFREMVHCGKDESIVRLHFRCDVQLDDFPGTALLQTSAGQTMPTLQMSIGYGAKRQVEMVTNPETGKTELKPRYDLQQIELNDLEIRLVNVESEDSELLLRAFLLNEEDQDLFAGERWFVDGILPESDKPESWKGFGCVAGRGFLSVNFVEPRLGAPNGYRLLRHIFEKLRDEISGFLRQIVHLGPIRPEPQRRYSFSRASADEWQARDWTAFRDFIGGRLGEAQTQEINHWLARLDLAKGGSEPRLVSEIGALVTEFEVAIRESEEASSLPLSAMGYGLSQVLPVIVQCVAARPGSLVIVEQPELHLHPRAQAELGDLFISKALESKETDRDKNDKDRKSPQFLLETHSEHLILRLMRRMRNTVRNELPAGIPPLTPEGIGVYVATRDQERRVSQMHLMEISPEGQLLEPWPGGFFEEDFIEQFS